jgi:adenylyltransferase/sulfurtransferase
MKWGPLKSISAAPHQKEFQNMSTITKLTSLAWEWKRSRKGGSKMFGVDDVYERQERLPWFSTEALRKASILGIGAGGLASFVYPSLARKGLGLLTICDEDTVEVSNLNRQAFFASDLFQPKAFALSKHAIAHSLVGCDVIAHRVDFDARSADFLADGVDIAFVGVDNNQTRAFASKYFRDKKIPVIFSAVNENADYGYVFIQQVVGACLGCIFPEAIRRAETEPRRCTASPAALDILQAVGAFSLYAIDSRLMARKRQWTYRTVSLVGGNDIAVTATQNPCCPLCRL